MGLRPATLMGLEPTTSCVTGMFRFVAPLLADVCERPFCGVLTRCADSADAYKCLWISAPNATRMLQLG